MGKGTIDLIGEAEVVHVSLATSESSMSRNRRRDRLGQESHLHVSTSIVFGSAGRANRSYITRGTDGGYV
jgi:hypothetical protein